MTPDGLFTLTLAKEDFKFSAGHFTLFGPDSAELLHGHNYRVAVEFSGPKLDDEGLVADFITVKTAIRRLCEEFDTQMLVPADSPHLQISEIGPSTEIRFRDKTYRLPTEDLLLLPVINTSIEVLARLLWQRLAAELDLSHLEAMGVSVAETSGQSCWFRARLR